MRKPESPRFCASEGKCGREKVQNQDAERTEEGNSLTALLNTPFDESNVIIQAVELPANTRSSFNTCAYA